MQQSKRKYITDQERKLFNALIEKGVPAKIEYPDGHKCVDIAIPDSKIYVEVDGMNHFDNPTQIKSDLLRDYYSDMEENYTFHITNQIVDNDKYFDSVVEALTEVIRERSSKIRNFQSSNLPIETKLLPVKPFQETLNGGFCGPAVIKMVLGYYGIEKTEAELAILTNKTVELGTSDKDIKKVIESFGLKVEIKTFADYEDIKTWLNKDVPVIVDWFTRGRDGCGDGEVADGHYSVVVGLDDKDIYLQDGEIGRVRKIAKEDFIRVWFDFKPDHIEKWEDMVIREMIAVYK